MDVSKRKLYESEHLHEGEKLAIWQEGDQRWMSFGEVTQSVICLSDRSKLSAEFSQTMMAFLLFVEDFTRVLMLGMGGAAIPRFFHHHDKNIRGDIVERSEEVIKLANDYFYFSELEKFWSIHNCDAREYLSRSNNNTYDLILVNIADGQSPPNWLTQNEELEQFRKLLMRNGVIVFNLVTTKSEDFLKHLKNIRAVFSKQTLCLSVPGHLNVIIFAFKQPPKFRNKEHIKSRLEDLTKKWGLEFDQIIQQVFEENSLGSGII